MLLKRVLASWNPNKYHILRELSLARVLVLCATVAALAVLVFSLLVLPSLFQSDSIVRDLSKTTNLTLTATMEQTKPTYLMQNPDVLLSTTGGNAWIVAGPEGLTVKRFVFFGEKTYPWLPFASLQTFPASSILVPVAIFLLPSFMFWGTVLVIVNVLLFGLLYTLISYFVLHAKDYRITYQDLWKVTLFAAIPSMTLGAVIPILRLGLPLAIVFGFLFALWLALSLLGTTLFAEKPSGRFSEKTEKHSHKTA